MVKTRSVHKDAGIVTAPLSSLKLNQPACREGAPGLLLPRPAFWSGRAQRFSKQHTKSIPSLFGPKGPTDLQCLPFISLHLARPRYLVDVLASQNKKQDKVTCLYCYFLCSCHNSPCREVLAPTLATHEDTRQRCCLRPIPVAAKGL